MLPSISSTTQLVQYRRRTSRLLVPYGPVNVESFALIRNDRLATLPSAPGNKPLQFVENWSYWAEYEERLTAEFEAWILSPVGTPEASNERED